MKRAAAVLLAAVLLLSAGCAGEGGAPAQAPSGAPSSREAAPAESPEENSGPPEEAVSEAPEESSVTPEASFQTPEASSEPPAPEATDPFDDEEVVAGELAEEAPREEAPAPAGEAGELPYVVYEDGRNRADIKEDMLQGIREWQEINSDTVGWLFVPHTTLDSPVLQAADNNTYYLTHNEWKEEDKNGALVSDFRNRFGGRDDQSRNIVLYGHSKDENPDGGVEASREYEHFTELKRYQDIDFCRENPYVMFAAGGEAMVWEIFAVFHTRTDFYYIQPDPSDAEFEAIVAEARQKSLFTFPEAEVGEGDKILTLSTCDRRIVPTYPNGYRFVIMAKLVEKGAPLARTAVVEENPAGLSPWNVY